MFLWGNKFIRNRTDHSKIKKPQNNSLMQKRAQQDLSYKISKSIEQTPQYSNLFEWV